MGSLGASSSPAAGARSGVASPATSLDADALRVLEACLRRTAATHVRADPDKTLDSPPKKTRAHYGL